MNVLNENGDLVISHSGIKGQKWGVRRFQNEDGTLTEEGKKRYYDTVFVSGSSKTQTEDSGYYRKELPQPVKEKIDEYMKTGSKFLVGDAPGIDRQVQDYLKSKDYKDVEIYSPGKENRYTANKDWKINFVDDPDHEPMSKEWLAKKDIAMTDRATKGLAVTLDEGSRATKENVARLEQQGKLSDVFELSKSGDLYDKFVNKIRHSEDCVMKYAAVDQNGNLVLCHYGVKGQHWGNRQYQNADGSLTPEGYRHYGIDPRSAKAGNSPLPAVRNIRTKYFDKSGAMTKKGVQYYKINPYDSADQIQSKINERDAQDQLKADKKERHDQIAKDITKGVIGGLAVAGVVAFGATWIKNHNLDRAHVRDMEKQKLLGKQELDRIKTTSIWRMKENANNSKWNIREANATGYWTNQNNKLKYSLDRLKDRNDLRETKINNATERLKSNNKLKETKFDNITKRVESKNDRLKGIGIEEAKANGEYYKSLNRPESISEKSLNSQGITAEQPKNKIDEFQESLKKTKQSKSKINEFQESLKKNGSQTVAPTNIPTTSSATPNVQNKTDSVPKKENLANILNEVNGTAYAPDNGYKVEMPKDSVELDSPAARYLSSEIDKAVVSLDYGYDLSKKDIENRKNFLTSIVNEDGIPDSLKVEAKQGLNQISNIEKYKSKGSFFKNLFRHSDVGFNENGDLILIHHGVKGQRWGVRRYQNEDGSLTDEGRKHYGVSEMTDAELAEQLNRERNKAKYAKLMTGEYETKKKFKSENITAINQFAGNATKNAFDVIQKDKDVKSKNYENAAKKADDEEDKKALTYNAKQYKLDAEMAKTAGQVIPGSIRELTPLEIKMATRGLDKQISETSKSAKEDVDDLQTKTLENLVKRLEMEKEYNELVNGHKVTPEEKRHEIIQSLAIVGSLVSTIAVPLIVASINKKKAG